MKEHRLWDEAERLRKTIHEGTQTVNQVREQMGLPPLTDELADRPLVNLRTIMNTFTPVFPELELAVTELLNARTSMGLYATILSDRTSSATGEVFVRKVVIADPQGLHTISQFCLQTPSGEADCFGLSKDSISAMDAKKYMEYLGAQEQSPGR
ncbi:hypothetical protein ACPT9H_18160 [Brevibacillus borstelensis]|uniref:hypothetical protein n=1 Tax=Brevibacillus borstelensis TaxID=45462 RepID=UPI003CE50000